MRYYYLLKQKDTLQDIAGMSFESCYYSGSMIGGAKKLSPTIYLKSGKAIKDIGVGFQTYTTWAGEENKFKKGETISECLVRYGYKVEDIEKIVVFCHDSSGNGVIHETFIWTPEKGWVKK